jgi:hypothetical protein
MTFSPRPLSELAKLRKAAPFLLAVALVGLVSIGCEDKHIGRVCSLATADGGAAMGQESATVNTQAVECPSRICLLPADSKTPTPNTTSLCTATCSSDDDCSDGETTSNSSSPQCKTGFTCMVATTVGDLCCERLCVCKDFVDTTVAGYNATPTSCMPGPTNVCQNVH